MKKNLLKITYKYFSKTVSVPPKLRNANTIDTKRNQGLFRYESLIDNPRDNSLNEEKINYNNLIEHCSKSMIINHFKLNNDENLNDFNQFYNFTSQHLDTKAINKFIQIIEEIKMKIESDDIEKTEDIFKFLLSKLYYLTDDRVVNETLIKMISIVPFKQISIKEIFRNKNELDLIQNGTDSNIYDKNKMESAVALSLIINNYDNNIHLKNPEFSDMMNPEVEFKDAMALKLQNYDKSFYLFQKKSELTKFDKTNFIFFNNLPVFFPVKTKSSGKIIIKQLTNSILLQNVLKMNKNQYYLSFNKAILEKALSIFSDLKINIKNVFFKKENNSKTSINHYDFDVNNSEFLDFIEDSEEYQNTEINKIKTKRSKKKTEAEKNQKNINLEDLIENTKFIDFKKIENDEILKKYSTSLIFSNGFIVAKDYKTKCDILTSSAGIFGFHILGKKNINLYDADFLHYLTVKNNTEKDVTYKELVKLINNELKLNNFSGPLIEIPENKQEIVFDQESFPADAKLNIRFNSFKYCYEALQILDSGLRYRVKYFKFYFLEFQS